MCIGLYTLKRIGEYMGFVGVRRSAQKLRRYAFLGRRSVLIRHKLRSNPQDDLGSTAPSQRLPTARVMIYVHFYVGRAQIYPQKL